MAQTKHRDDQLFVGPVEFLAPLVFGPLATALFQAAVTHGAAEVFQGTANFEALATFEAAATFQAAATFEAGVVRVGRELLVPAADAVAGAASGWLVTGANDGLARLPAAETNSTLVIPVKGLHVGDTVTGMRVIGQVESVGANATLILSARKSTAAIADFVDAEMGTANIGTVSADTLIEDTVLEVTGLTEVLDELETIYALLTGTTAALTDIAIGGLVITYTAG